MLSELKTFSLLINRKLEPDIPKDIKKLFIPEIVIQHLGLDDGFIFIVKTLNMNWIKYFVEKGARFNFEECQAFAWAVYNGHLEIVKYLVEMGLVLYPTESYILKMASENGHLEMVKFFIEHGVDMCDERGIPKWRHFKDCHLEVFKFFIEYGIKNYSIIQRIIVESTLGWVSYINRLDIVEYLLIEKKANIHWSNDFAIRSAIEGGYLEIVKFLIKHGADVNIAFKYASDNNRLDIITYLKSIMP